MERTKTIELLAPVEHEGGIVSRLELRAPTFGEWIRANQARTPLDEVASIVSIVSGVPRAVIERMQADQVLEAGDFVMGFLRRGPGTGEN